MDLVEGKLYEVTDPEGLEFLPFAKWNNPDKSFRDSLYLVAPGRIIFYLGTAKKEFSDFSKFLIDDKVYITYNGFQLRNRVKQINT